MRFMILIYGDEAIESRMSQDEWQALLAEHTAFGTKYGDKVLSGEALEPTSRAKTLRRADGAVTTLDGPFAETKEQLGGYYLIEADTIDQAVVMARDIPLSDYGSIEVRPIMALGE